MIANKGGYSFAFLSNLKMVANKGEDFIDLWTELSCQVVLVLVQDIRNMCGSFIPQISKHNSKNTQLNNLWRPQGAEKMGEIDPKFKNFQWGGGVVLKTLWFKAVGSRFLVI